MFDNRPKPYLLLIVIWENTASFLYSWGTKVCYHHLYTVDLRPGSRRQVEVGRDLGHLLELRKHLEGTLSALVRPPTLSTILFVHSDPATTMS